MPFIFPLEIEETILNLLAEDEDEADKGHSALKTCSLVCRAFLPICRKHIFGIIALHAWPGHESLIHAFEHLLRETPEIADYIRKLDYSIRTEDLTSPSIEESLKRISKLKFLAIWNYRNLEFNWSNNPIRPALLHLLHLPTLTHFQMSSINDFVVSDLTPCVNLKFLDIGVDTTVADENAFPAGLPEHSIQLNEFESSIGTSDAIKKLCSARRPDGLPIIDFSSLSKLTVCPEEPNEGEASRELLRRCCVLTDVKLSFADPRKVRPSITDRLRPFMQTLKHIVVSISIDHDDTNVDPLFGIPSELEDMRTKNIIETIGIQILTAANCRRGDDWDRLDEVLTKPGWFSSLEEVSVYIEIENDRLDEDDALEVAFHNLAFPQLLSSDSILFFSEVRSIPLIAG